MTVEVILIAILMFFVLVSVHEWGHFHFARRAGVLTREFAIGFGPKIFAYKKGETRYTFRLFPAGGYVRMAGEDPELVQVNKGQTIAVRLDGNRVTHLYLDKLDQRLDVVIGTVESIDLEHKLQLVLEIDGELERFDIDSKALMIARGSETQIAPWNRQFGSKTVGQRAMIIFAGPMMNIILAAVLFFVFVMMSGVPVENPTYVLIGHVYEDTPAEQAGLKENDIVYTVDGTAIGGSSEKLQQLIADSPERTMNWTVIRNQEKVEMQVTPEAAEGIGRIGIAIQLPTRSPGLGEALVLSGETMWNATNQIFTGLRMLVTLQFTLDDLGGPVRVAEVTGEAYSLGINTLIFWVAVLSLYLGIFNLLPFPALDGSRLVFFGIEALRGKPVEPSKEGMVHFIGFAMLMLLMIAVTYNDILRLFKS